MNEHIEQPSLEEVLPHKEISTVHYDHDGTTGKLIQKEDRYALQQKINDLKEKLEAGAERIAAVENSKKFYGDAGFSTMLDGVEITPALLEQERQELAVLESQKKALSPKGGSVLKTLRRFLSL